MIFGEGPWRRPAVESLARQRLQQGASAERASAEASLFRSRSRRSRPFQKRRAWSKPSLQGHQRRPRQAASLLAPGPSALQKSHQPAACAERAAVFSQQKAGLRSCSTCLLRPVELVPAVEAGSGPLTRSNQRPPPPSRQAERSAMPSGATQPSRVM